MDINPTKYKLIGAQRINITQVKTSKTTRWLYCVECPQYIIRLEALPFGHDTPNRQTGQTYRQQSDSAKQ